MRAGQVIAIASPRGHHVSMMRRMRRFGRYLIGPGLLGLAVSGLLAGPLATAVAAVAVFWIAALAVGSVRSLHGSGWSDDPLESGGGTGAYHGLTLDGSHHSHAHHGAGHGIGAIGGHGGGHGGH
jgi:hypothetical protein